MTALRFIILSISIAAHVLGKKLDCASGWVPYNGGWLDQEWRVDGGCFWGIPNAQACNASWSICAKANSMLATKRSRDGTEAPLTVREFLNFGRVQRLSGYSEAEAHVCVTKHAGYIPPEANIQRSKKACSTREITTTSTTPTTTTTTRVILISGGWKDGLGDLNSAEIFNPVTNTSCSLPPLPKGRFRHTQDGGLACGVGHLNAPETLTCVKWSPASGTWNQSHTLTQKRSDHASWATSSGVYLFGGYYSPRTSEKVKMDGSVEEGFSLKYDTRYACSISDPDNEEVIITGGLFTRKTVSVYSEAGWQSDLTSLNQGRYWHACGHYANGEKTIFLVTGGYDGSNLDSTEIFSDNVWRTVAAKLPAPVADMRVATIENRMLLFGGHAGANGGERKEILEFNYATESWTTIGLMKETKSQYAMTVVSFNDYEKWCN